MLKEYAVQMSASNRRFGAGITKEVGMDLKDPGLNRVQLMADKNSRNLRSVYTVEASLIAEGIKYDIYDDVRVEPTDTSIKQAMAFAQSEKYQAYVAVSGGSVIDTAKAANLYARYPAERLFADAMGAW